MLVQMHLSILFVVMMVSDTGVLLQLRLLGIRKHVELVCRPIWMVKPAWTPPSPHTQQAPAAAGEADM